jgi:hypothetical protein
VRKGVCGGGGGEEKDGAAAWYAFVQEGVGVKGEAQLMNV